MMSVLLHEIASIPARVVKEPMLKNENVDRNLQPKSDTANVTQQYKVQEGKVRLGGCASSFMVINSIHQS